MICRAQQRQSTPQPLLARDGDRIFEEDLELLAALQSEQFNDCGELRRGRSAILAELVKAPKRLLQQLDRALQ